MADGEIKISINGDDSGLGKTLDGVSGKAEKSLSALNKFANIQNFKMMVDVLKQVSDAIVGVGQQFEASFAQVATIMDTAVLSAEGMKDQILALSTETGIAGTELASTVYNAISATGDTANAVQLAGDASKLATAGFTDSASALSVLTTTINAYNMETTEAAKISDSLVQTQNLGVTTIAELSSSMGKAIASASAYGIDLYNVEAAYVAMTKSGISTAESTTYMSGMFKELGKDGSDIAKVLKEKTGKSFSELMASGASIADVLGVIYESVGNDKAAFMNMWSSAEAGKAAIAIVNRSVDEFNSNLQTLQDSSGTTEAAYETMCNTVAHQSELLKNSFKNLGVGIYESFSGELATTLAGANEMVGSLMNAFNVGGIDAMIAQFGNLAPKIAESVTGMFPKIASAMASKLPMLLNSVMKGLPAALKNLRSAVPILVSGMGEMLGTAAENLITMIPSLFEGLGPAIIDTIVATLGGLDRIVTGILDGAKNAIRGYDPDSLITDTFGDGGIITLNADIDATVTDDKALSKITQAYTEVQNALDGVNLDPSLANQLIGQTYDQVYATLKGFGLSDADAAIIAGKVVVLNSEVSAALSGLSVKMDTATIARLFTEAGGCRTTLVTACKAMGLKESDIQIIAGVWDQINGSLADRVPKIYETIAGALTDGKADTEEVVNELKNLLNVLGVDSGSAMDDYINSLDPSTDGYDELVAKAKEDKAALEGLVTAANQWVEAMAGKSTEYVQAHLTELQTLLEQINAINAAYATATESARTAGQNAYDTVVAGGIVDAGTIDLAFTYTYNGYKTAQESLDNDYNAQVQALQAQLTAGSITLDEYNVQIEGLKVQYDADSEANKTAFQTALMAMFQGLGESTLSQEALDKAMSAGQKLSLANAINALFDDEDIDFTQMGFDDLPQQLQEALLSQFEGADFSNTSGIQLQQYLAEMLGGVTTDYEDAVNELTKDPAFEQMGAVMSDAITMGLFNGTDFEGMDQTQLVLALMAGLIPEDLMGQLNEYVSSVTENSDPIKVDTPVEGETTAAGVDGADATKAELDKEAEEKLQGDGTPVEYEQQADVKVTPGETTVDNEVSEAADAAVEDVKDEVEETPEVDVTANVTGTITATFDVSVSASDGNPLGDAVSAEVEKAIEGASGGTYTVNQTADVEIAVNPTITGADFTSLGSTAGNEFANGVASAASTAAAAGRALSGAVLAALGSTDTYSLGVDFSEGYAKGIKAGSSTAINAAIEMAVKALKAVQSAQDSNSPSKETQKLGTYFGQGYAEGIESSMRDAVQTAKRMTGEILNAASIGSNGMGVIRVEAGSEPLQVAMDGADAPVYLDGEQIATIQGNHNRSELAWLQTRQNRGVGR